MLRVIGGATAQKAGLVLMMVCLLFAGSPAQAQPHGKRMALLIGNAKYDHEVKLRNPLNDVALLGRVFKVDLKFDTVVMKENLSALEMDRAIAAFVRSAQGKQVASLVFYFSGHGLMTSEHENILLPVDANLSAFAPEMPERQIVRANSVRDKLKSINANVTLLILDACRDRPGAVLTKGTSKGLAAVGGGNKELFAYATEEGKTALDGAGANSPYAEALAVAFRKTNLSVLQQFEDVADAVSSKVRGQIPTHFGNLRVATFLVPPPEPIQAVTTSSPVPASPVPNCDFCPEMVMIPAGQFQMGANTWLGNAAPVHTVKMGAFMLSKYEVTQGQWEAVMGTNPSRFKDCGVTCPVESVSWDDIQAYVQKLNAKTGGKYRLPSEAEWEYAARAGGTGQWGFGDDEKQLGQYGWYGLIGLFGNSERKTHPVGLKEKNKFGLHDMYGNVCEWVADCYHDNYNGAPVDGSAWTKNCGKYGARVLRGGGWNFSALNGYSAYRLHDQPDGRAGHSGFRLALGSSGPAGQ
jgi:formylglycine-generating enzyme required for sulfatase activity